MGLEPTTAWTTRTTLIYADYAPGEHEAEWVEQAFRSTAADVIDEPASG